MSDIILSNIQLWRQKAAAGTLSLEEAREAIAAIRKERAVATEVSATAKKRLAISKATKTAIDSNALLDELDFG